MIDAGQADVTGVDILRDLNVHVGSLRWTSDTVQVVPTVFTLPRFRVLLAALVVGGLWPASPALADAARPGNTASVVQSIEPAALGVVADIVGGDAFLRVRATPGVEVEIPGYLGEPYLWIRSDGTVWRNASSPATVLNEDRYITGPTPDMSTRPDQVAPEPRWEAYGQGGTVLWHDHRVHWMGTGTPPTIDPDGLVQRWEVPMTVDGVPVTVAGGLFRLEGASTWWWGVAIVVAGLLAISLRMGARPGAVAMVAAVVAAVVNVVAWTAWASLPTPARSAPVIGLLAVLAVLATAAAWWGRRSFVAGPALAGAGAALLLAGWSGRTGVTAAVVPGLDQAWLWRVSIAAAVGAGAVSLVSGAQTASRSRAPVSLDG